MKNRNFKIGALLVSLFAASCSPALYQSGAYNIDDMYAEHDVTRIAQEKQAIAEARKAEAEARRAEIEARQAEAAYYASDDSYQGVLLFQPSLQRHLPIRFGLRPGRLQHHRHGRRSVGRTQIHYFDVRHMGFSQHSELRMERRSLQRLVFQLGLQSLSLGIPRFRLALLQLQPLLGVSLLGRLLPLLGLLSRLGRRPSPPPVPAAPSAQCRTPFDLSIRLGSRIEHRIDQFRRPRTGRYDQRLQKRHHDR